ncbi:uncharacterized protein LOC126891954 [Diabrotica virgifera virgifera]|uniref:C2H2-type domain-containing protein n=1 Tax=Diabrotica virgifera virgifera TaxID=50390 RepID=A0ABM5L4A7_DIAVI|nr:uncharacterized protein LOC126891954 [Diabrotica virgifera virgifera]
MSEHCCKVCNISFSLKGNLTKHLKTQHEKNKVKYDCGLCEYSSPRKDSLKEHRLKKHRPNFEDVNLSEIKKSVVACAMCDHKTETKTVMLEHYKLKHGITLAEKESLTFVSEDKFLEWKLEVENSDKNNFVCRRPKESAAGGKSISTFHCFRDGYFKTKGSNLRREKVLGSNKINGYCPAKMVAVTLPTGEVKVDFYRTHVGHQNDIKRMRLSKGERDKIAKNIAAKIPLKNILDNLRATVSNDEVKRRDLITLQDIRNVARDYKLKVKRKVKPKKTARRKLRKVSLQLDVCDDDRDHNDSFTHEEPVESVPQDTILGDMQNQEMIPGIGLKRKKELAMNEFLSVLHGANSEVDVDFIIKMIRQTQASMCTQNSVQNRAANTRIKFEH